MSSAQSFLAVYPSDDARANNLSSSVETVNSGLQWIHVSEHDRYEDVGALFEMALCAEEELPLLRGYCRYSGFNGREVDGVFLLSNKRLILFSMEAGAKIVLVEVAKRLLGKLPVPFLGSIGSFLLFSLPRAAYVALRGGKKRLIARALSVREDRLLSERPPLRKVHEHGLSQFKDDVSQMEIGPGAWTGLLGRKFGIAFSPTHFSKSFRVPLNLILSEHDTLEPIEQLLSAIEPTLAKIGLSYRFDTERCKLSIGNATAAIRAAA